MALMIRCNKYEGSTKTIPVNRGKIFLNGFKFFITPSSIMIVEVVRTNFRLLLFFLQGNFTSIKSIKIIYKQISDILKHKMLNKQLSLRSFMGIKSTKLYEHKKLCTRCCLYEHKMGTKWCIQMLFMSTDDAYRYCLLGHKMSTRCYL